MIKTLSRFRLPRNWGLFTAFPFLVSAAVLPTSGSAREPHFSQPIVTQGWTRAGYPYLNGGISFDQRRAMERAASGYNLKLVFANHVGTPAMPSFLVIGANDGSPIEKISLHGPWFYIRLPAGSYTILVRFKHHSALVRDVHIRQDRQRAYVFRGDRRRAEPISDN